MNAEESRTPASKKRTPDDKKEYQEYLEYLDYVRKASNEPADISVKEEMHPDFTNGDRFAVKNFGHGDEANAENIAYLQKKHPDLQIAEKDGRIISKRPEEKEFRVLDPDTGLFSSDIIRDGLDLAAPTMQGAIEGGAAALGSLAGLPGAVAAGSAAGLTTERLRQWMSQNLGLYKSPNNFEIGLNAGLNGAFPVAGRAISVAANKAFPVVANVLSGVPRKAISTTLERLPELDALESGGSLFDFSQQAKSKISDPLFRHLDKYGSELSTAIKNAGGYVDVNAAPLFEMRDRLMALSGPNRLNTPALASEVKDASNFIDQHFLINRKPYSRWDEVKTLVPGSVTDDFGNLHTHLPGLPNKPDLSSTPMKYNLSSLALEPDQEAMEQLKKMAAKYELAKARQTPVMVPRSSVVEETVTPAKEYITRLDPEAAWELQKRAGDLAQYSKMPPTPGMISSRNMTDQARALDEIYESLGEGLSNATGGASQELKDRYKEVANLRRLINGHFGTPERTYQSLTNMDGKSKRMLNDYMSSAKRLTGVDVSKDADLLAAQAHFGDKAHGGQGLNWLPISGGGTTSTSRSLVANNIRAALDGLGLAAASGGWGLLGVPLLGPKAMKAYTRGIYNTGQALRNPAINFGARATPPTVWHLLHEADRQPGE